jgi:glycosyltransferase involved in cell wall biosynthesis
MTSKLTCWLVTVGEPLPTDGPDERLLRTGILAELLRARGHEVVWWSSAFDHQRKLMRRGLSSLRTTTGVDLRLLKARGYARNVSVARLVDNVVVARAFRAEAGRQRVPDVVVASYPTIDLASEAVRFGRRARVPVILDLRDQWPDVFERVLPGALRFFSRILLAPMRRQARDAMAGASSLVGITPEFLRWGLTYAGREANRHDAVVRLGYDATPPRPEEVRRANAHWDALGIRSEDASRRLVFTGSIGRQVRFEQLTAAIMALRGEHVELVICGDGDQISMLKGLARGISNVRLVGWCDRAQLWTLLRRSRVGVLPYAADPDFVDSVPNKVAEYFSAGLPVISTLPGSTARLLADHLCGLTLYPQDVNGWIEAIRNMLQKDTVHGEMSCAARAVYESMFASGSVYTDFAERIEQIAAGSRAGDGRGEC